MLRRLHRCAAVVAAGVSLFIVGCGQIVEVPVSAGTEGATETGAADSTAAVAASDDTSSSGIAAACGNGELDPDEVCDGESLRGESCDSLGFDAGELSCTANCTLDMKSCTRCGDGIRQAAEACDGTDLNDVTCRTLGLGEGELACEPDCSDLVRTGCTGQCADVPPPPGGRDCPAECTGGCAGSACSIECEGDGDCSGAELVCPEGWSCRLLCSGADTCVGSELACSVDGTCEAVCPGSGACADLTLLCGGGHCTLKCEAAESCVGADIQCAAQACTTICSNGAAQPNQACGEACSCLPCGR